MFAVSFSYVAFITWRQFPYFVEGYLSFNRLLCRKTNIVVIENACYTFDGPNHNADKMHNKAIEEMREAGAKIVRVNEKEKVASSYEEHKEY